MRMLAKIYFWVILVLNLIGTPMVLTHFANFTLGDIRGVFESILITLVPYSYGFKRTIFKPGIWKVLFWYLVIFAGLDIGYAISPDINLGLVDSLLGSGLPEELYGGAFGIVLTYILLIPVFIFTYRLGYHSEER